MALAYYILFAGIWSIGNGILHDIFVLMQGRPFEKPLIHLLIDGHILIFAGIFYLIAYKGVRSDESWAYYISIASALFLLGYCGLIFKMLPSVGMIGVNLVALIWLLIKLQGNTMVR